jgi:hypothetical protein
MADSRKKVQLLRATKGKMQVELPHKLLKEFQVLVRDDKDREEDEELDALSTTDELEVDTRYERRQESVLQGNALRSPFQIHEEKCDLDSTKPFWATLKAPEWLYPTFVKDEERYP